MTEQQFYQDAAVYDAGGEKIGTLHTYDPQAGYITVQKGFLFHTELCIPLSAVQETAADGTVRLNLFKDDLAGDRYATPPVGETVSDDAYGQRTTVAETAETVTTPTRRHAQTDDTLNVPVYEEELIVGKQREQIGDVHLHKDVVTEQQSVPVTLHHEQVTVERVPFTGQVSQDTLDHAFQNASVEVPVMGEEAVVGKESHVVEEVRLHKNAVTEQQQVTDTVRKEHVVVDGVDEHARTRRS